jgi:signal transduction histidine kinase
MPERDAGTSHDGEQLCELSHLSAAISHHVINAFSAIVSSAELIRSHTVSASDHSELDALATAIVESALDASQVSRRLIDWSRRGTTAARGQAGSEMPAVDINQLIRERVESEKAVATGHADWVLSLGSIPSIPGNATALGPMLSCLLRNAREALPREGGAVAVSTFTDPRGWVVIAIRDSGCGMTTEVLRRAIEPFFSTKPDHYGVGLTIAQAIWRRHGGTLATESQPGQGTTIRLSVAPSQAARPLEPSPGAP